jgi:hypothetical protein
MKDYRGLAYCFGTNLQITEPDAQGRVVVSTKKIQRGKNLCPTCPDRPLCIRWCRATEEVENASRAINKTLGDTILEPMRR